MLAKLAKKNPGLAVLIHPVADAFDLDPDHLAAVFLGVAISADVSNAMKRAEAMLAEAEAKARAEGEADEEDPPLSPLDDV